MMKEERQYYDRYGHLPDTTEELLKVIETTKKLDFDKIKAEEERIRNIKWHTMEILLPMVPKGSPRPRKGKYGNFYVKGAKRNKKIIKQYLYELNQICTRIEYSAELYLPMPSGMTNVEIYLAEKKVIMPLSKPDFDNGAKTYTDPLEGEIFLNDLQLNPGHITKYYSIKPRIHIFIRYQDDFDCNFNRNKILKSKAYQDLIAHIDTTEGLI